MSPRLKSGDLLFVEEEQDFEIGDIIVFYDDTKSLISHRLMSKDPLKTKGDRAKNYDSIINTNKIVGRVCFIKREKHLYHLKRKIITRIITKISSLNIQTNPIRLLFFALLWPLSFYALKSSKIKVENHNKVLSK